jgi:hypothetical protein
MGCVFRLAVAAALLLAVTPRAASAIPIVVAEFRWDATLLDPGVECDAGDPSCEATAATYLSTYSLTGLWDGPEPAPTLGGTVALGGSTGFDWLPITFDAGYFDQLGLIESLPTFALTTVFFDFGGEVRSLTALLDAPGFATLSFDSDDVPSAGVPEPGTMSLLGLGLATFVLQTARRTRRRRSLAS